MSFRFAVHSADGKGVPLAVAGKIMIDIQNLISDIGCSQIKTKMRLFNSMPQELSDKFVIKINKITDKGIGSGTGEGGKYLTEMASDTLQETLQYLGSGITETWMEDHFPDSFYRSRIARDLIELCDDLSGYELRYFIDKETFSFKTLDRKNLSKYIGSNVPSREQMIGYVSMDPRSRKMTFLSSDKPVYLSKAVGDRFSQGKIYLVMGTASKDSSGKIISLSSVDFMSVADSISFRDIITPDRYIRLANNVPVAISYDKNRKVWEFFCETINLGVSSPTWDDGIVLFHKKFAEMWDLYTMPGKTFSDERDQMIQGYMTTLIPLV